MTQVIPIPCREPQSFAVGDNRSWTKNFTNYPAGAWTLHYVIRNQKYIYKFDAVSTGDTYTVTLDSTTTANWKPGVYQVGAYLTGGGEQVRVRPSFPTLTLLDNIAVAPAGVDTLTWAESCLASIERTILALTSRKVESANVNGSMYSLANIRDLYLMRERFKSEVSREHSRDRLNAGLGAGNKIGIRFKPLNQQGYPAQIRVPWQ